MTPTVASLPSGVKAQSEQTDEPQRIDSPGAVYMALKGLRSGVESLCWHCRTVHDRLAMLDNAGRHDEAIDDQMWQLLSAPVEDAALCALMRAQREIERARQSLAMAHGAVSDVFGGDLKGKTEGALSRHRAETERLAASFGQLIKELQMPRLPYLIRQRFLSGLVTDLREVAGSAVDLRKRLHAGCVGDGMMTAVRQHESNLCRVRATVARLRDNPSQKMGRKLSDCFALLCATREGLRDLKAEALQNCTLARIKIWNRGGPIN